MSSPKPAIPDATAAQLRREAVACQMDDLNALAEAVVTALNEGDKARAAGLRVSMDRFVLALGWNLDGVLPAVLAYASEHRDDELFAPGFVLQAIAPEKPETADLLAEVSPDIQALLERLRSIAPT
jgi:hypothetical protein